MNIVQFCQNNNDIIAIIFVIITIFATLFFLRQSTLRFQQEMEEREKLIEQGLRTSKIGDDGEIESREDYDKNRLKDKPDIHKHEKRQLAIALVGLVIAIISWFGGTNPVITLIFDTSCINTLNYFNIGINQPINSPILTLTPVPVTAVPPTIQASHTLIPTSTDIPTVMPTMVSQRFHLLPLERGVFWTNGYNLGLTSNVNNVSERELLGIPFEIGRQINTPGCPPLISENDYSLQTNLQRPLAVYILIQAGNGLTSYENDVIGRLELYFADNRVLLQDLILGFNIRDWVRNKTPGIAVMDITSDMSEEAWHGEAAAPDAGWLGGMDMLTLQIPQDHQNSELRTIRLLDTSIENNGSDQPCIHLQAVTVETATY